VAPELHLRYFLGKVIPVSLETLQVLRDVESTFFLIIVGNDPASHSLESTLDSFLTHYKPSRLLLRVSIEDEPIAPAELSAAILPQFRIYVDGNELRRHRGTISYEMLFSFLGVHR